MELWRREKRLRHAGGLLECRSDGLQVQRALQCVGGEFCAGGGERGWRCDRRCAGWLRHHSSKSCCRAETPTDRWAGQ